MKFMEAVEAKVDDKIVMTKNREIEMKIGELVIRNIF